MGIKQAESKEIERLKAQLLKLGAMRPGSLSKQFNVCGVKNCKCKDPKNPQKHGPYFKLSYVYAGKNKTQFIKKEFAKEIEKQTLAFKKFKDIFNVLTGLYIERSNQMMRDDIGKLQQK